MSFALRIALKISLQLFPVEKLNMRIILQQLRLKVVKAKHQNQSFDHFYNTSLQ